MTPVSPSQAAQLFARLAAASAIVLAVSGGPDSTALLLLAARWRAARKKGPKLVAATVDHGLRPGSAAEAKAVAQFARSLGIAHETLRWTGGKPVSGLQEKARLVRYRLLADVAERVGAEHILTAHTLDDQAETVLLRLCRGSGVSGLAGMARVTPLYPLLGGKSGKPNPRKLLLVRPLLGIAKSRLIATLKAARIAFADDPSNRDPRFTRARLRKLVPALAAEGLDARRLALLARRVARAEAAIESAVDDAQARLALPRPADAASSAFDAQSFGRLSEETALRLLGRAIAAVAERPVALGKLEALTEAMRAWRDQPPAAVRFRRTLAGAVVTLDANRLTVNRAPARRTAGPKSGAEREKNSRETATIAG